MKTVFVDTNIILDVLLQNEDFWQDSLKIIRLAERGEIRACVSASSMTDIFYVARKKLTAPVARTAIEKLLDLFNIIGVDGDDLRSALTIPIDDVEDALQAWCAKKAGAEMIITRNVKDFNNIDILSISPADYK
jgi:predicted nucleic acid-binding protein